MRPHNVEAARELRQRMTLAEATAWRLLRDRRLGGVKFRRQHPVGAYVLDFCCASLRLAVELDGGVHERQQDSDGYRQRELESSGYRILRFTNEDVLHRPDWFVDRVAAEISANTQPAPRCSPPKGFSAAPAGDEETSPLAHRNGRGGRG